MSNDLVYRFPKNEKEEFGFSVREFKDRLYCDIRIYFKGSDGGWHPTRKGVSFSAGFMGEMKKGVSEIAKQLSTQEAGS
jgi:hypothetical protein